MYLGIRDVILEIIFFVPKSVQEVVAAIHHYKCNRGMVITNSVYTSNATHLAKKL